MAGVRKEGILLVDDVGGDSGVPVEISGPLGSQVAADSVSVAIASDQLPLPITGTIEVAVGAVDQGDPAVVANAWPIKVTNGVNTANVNNDGQLDVAAWPPTDQTANGTITALNEYVTIPNISGYNSVTVEIPSGATLVGTLKFAIGLAPDIINYCYAFDTLNNKWVDSITDVSVLNTWRIPGVSGYDIFVICTDYTSGSVDVFLSVTTAIINNPGLTEEELRSTPLEVTSPPNELVTGTIDAVLDAVTIDPPEGYNSIAVKIETSFDFGGTIIFHLEDSTSFPIYGLDLSNSKWVNEIVFPVLFFSSIRNLSFPVVPESTFSVLCTAYTSGSATVTIISSSTRLVQNALTNQELGLRVNVLGQNTAANSTPVVLASDQLPAAAALADNTSNPTLTKVSVYPMVYDGSTWDRLRGDSVNGLTVNTELPAAAALADDVANPTTPLIGACGMLYDSTNANWDRATTGQMVLDGLAGAPRGLDTKAYVFAQNTVTTGFDRLSCSTMNSDAVSAVSISSINAKGFGYNYNGSVWERTRGDSTNGLLVNLGANNDVVVSATDLDIRNLTFANDKVDASGSAITLTKATTGTQTQVPDDASSVTILAANSNRLGATILNTSTVTLYLRLSSSAATTSNYTVALVANAYYEVPFWYSGQITGIWASDPGTGNANVTELT